MKNLIVLLIFLILTATVFAEPVEYRKQNVATRICGTLLDITTARRIGVAASGVACDYAQYTNGANEAAYSAVAGTPAAVGTAGQFCVTLTAGEMNIAGNVRIYCAATGIASSSSYQVVLRTIKTDIADGGIGALAQAFDGQTLAEGTNTLDLEANEITVDNQFVGDKIALFTSAGAYYASSCIISSTNANERVTTEENLASLHTVGDYYVIRPDAGCTLTAQKLQTDAVTEFVNGVFSKAIVAVTALPTDGTESFEKIVRSIYQRFFHKVTDNTAQAERQIFQTGGIVKWCEAPTSASGGVFTTGVCGTVD